MSGYIFSVMRGLCEQFHIKFVGNHNLLRYARMLTAWFIQESMPKIFVPLLVCVPYHACWQSVNGGKFDFFLLLLTCLSVSLLGDVLL